ncbi:DUF927 domain-containing protein [Planobispora rosea]|nr:DUF927 domain-containing protein [Planobispora rosea]
MPPVDIAPRGYGTVAGTPEQWAELLGEVARSPKMALVVGLTIGGLYLRPLGRQSYMVQIKGGSSEGKTTTLICSASQFGRPEPDGVIRSWSVTKQGPGSWLRSLHCLTGFRDELGSSAMRADQLEASIFSYLQGAERDSADRSGEHRDSQGSWRGCLASTGNESILSQIANEGIAARVIEVSSPLTIDAEHAERVERLACQVYGHGLAAVIERGLRPGEFAELAARCLAEMGAPGGGVVRRLAKSLSFGVAGAVMLAELAGVPALADAARAAAGPILEELGAHLIERGADPGARLLAAVADAMAARPGEWPTRHGYEAMIANDRYPREVAGWDLSSDEGVPAEVAVIPAALRRIAAEADIKDVTIALQNLKARGLLHVQASGKKGRVGYQGMVKVAGSAKRAHLLSGLVPVEVDEPDTQEIPQEQPAQGSTGEPVQPTLELVAEAAPSALEPEAEEPAPHGQPEPGMPTDMAVEMPPPPGSTAEEFTAVNTAPRAADTSAAVPASKAPVSEMNASNDDPPAPAGRVLALAADADGLYTCDGENLTAVEAGPAFDSWPAFLEAVADLIGSGSIAITAQLAIGLGYPEAPSVATPGSRTRVPGTRRKKSAEAPIPRAISEAAAAGWQCSRKGIGAWTSWFKAGSSLQVAVIDWQSREHIQAQCALYLSPADTAMEAAYLLARYRSLTGVPFAYNAGSSFTTMIRERYERGRREPGARTPLRKWDGAGTPAKSLRPREVHLVWQRPIELWTPEELAAQYVIPYDKVWAYLGAINSANLAWDPLEHAGVDAGFQPGRAGYWLVGGSCQPFELLPDLLFRTAADGTGPVWRETTTVAFALKHGLPAEALIDAYLAPEAPAPAGRVRPGRKQGQSHTGRITKEIAERLGAALASLPEGEGVPELPAEEERVRRAVKATYAEGYGMLAHGTAWVQRPDWTDAVVATARTTLIRKVVEIGRQSGRWPIGITSDCAYYATASPDPVKENPGFPLLQRGRPAELGLYRTKSADIMTASDWRRTKLGMEE